MNVLKVILRVAAAAILIQTLYFKFSGAEESKFIFSSLGVEPWGRWFAGFSELFASILLLLPSTYVFGAFLGANIMVGAILSHIFVLGIVVQADGGLLFGLACLVFLSCAVLVLLEREKLIHFARRILGR